MHRAMEEDSLMIRHDDDLSIITTINTRTKYKLQQNRHIFTNYRKANWTQFTTDTEAVFSNIQQQPDTLHIQTTSGAHKTQNITQKQHFRAQNASDPSISDLHSEITSLIQTHKSDIWREHLDTHWDHILIRRPYTD